MSLQWLFEVIRTRQTGDSDQSYTRQLLEGGVARIAQKVGEEAVETVVAALSQDDRRLTEELADLTYHVLVLLAARGLTPADVQAELQRRHHA
jgi:phosphoribosyl-ATP pyrophosphohydrolase